MRILGLSCAVPRHISQASDHYELLGKETVDRIINNIGVQTRRTVVSGCTSDLCAAAAENLFEKINIDRNSIEAIVYITQTADFLAPGTSGILQARLNLSNDVLAFDINRGCPGFCDGFLIAQSLLQGLGLKRVLLLVGDTPSLRFSPSNQGAAPLFGDAGSATILEASSDSFSYIFGTDGSGAMAIHCPVGYRKGLRPNEEIRNNEQAYEMDGIKVYEFTIERVPAMIRNLLTKAKWNKDDVDAFLFHQANRYIIQNLSRLNRIPLEKVPLSIEEFGNTSCASIPLTIVSRLREFLTKPQKLLMLGFGTGLAWTGIAWNWDPQTIVCPLLEIDC